MDQSEKRVLVVSAHAADYVWRAGGTIANYLRAGATVKILCLSYGQRGESESAWANNPGITEEEVCEIRRKESEAASKLLGCEIVFYGLQDHYMVIDRDTVMRLAKDIRDFQPDIVLTHSVYDPFNPDHDSVHKAVLAALRSANVTGTFPETKKIKQPEIFCYEPDQPDISGFMADVMIDITDSWDLKLAAMKCFPTQAFMIQTYGLRTEFRGTLASRFGKGGSIKHATSSKEGVKYAEFFKRITPYVGQFFE